MATRGPLLPTRYIFTALVSIGLAIIYGLKVNMSVAIVVMINSTELAEKSAFEHRAHWTRNSSYFIPTNETSPSVSMTACEAPDNVGSNPTVTIQDGPFAWSEPVQGLVLGAYFWGYILTQIPGGRLAETYSAKWVIWGSVFTNVIFTLLTPVAANISYIAVLVVRFIEGLGAGVSLPAIHVMLTKWALPQERNLISSLAYAGMALGTVISLPFSGVLADLLGWESVFYVQGGLALIWCGLWLVCVYDSPEEHPRIHPTELALFFISVSSPLDLIHGSETKEEITSSAVGSVSIEPTLEDGQQCDHGVIHEQVNLPVPWRDLLSSRPFWAILIAHTCANFGWYMLLVELPTYMKSILRFNISQNAGLSAVPYLSLWIFSIAWSNRLDWAKNKGWISTTNVRKLSTAMASLLPAACFIGVSLVGCNRQAAVALMTIGTMFVAGMYCGFLTNHVDIAPNYAGTLMALTNTAATIPGFIVPVFVGQLTDGNQTLGQWQIIFFTTAGIYVVEFIAYSLMGSGEEQFWNEAFTNIKSDCDKQQINSGKNQETGVEKINLSKRKKIFTI